MRRCQNNDNYPVAHESATISAFAGSYRKSVRFAVSIPVAKQPPKVTIYLYSLYPLLITKSTVNIILYCLRNEFCCAITVFVDVGFESFICDVNKPQSCKDFVGAGVVILGYIVLQFNY